MKNFLSAFSFLGLFAAACGQAVVLAGAPEIEEDHRELQDADSDPFVFPPCEDSNRTTKFDYGSQTDRSCVFVKNFLARPTTTVKPRKLCATNATLVDDDNAESGQQETVGSLCPRTCSICPDQCKDSRKKFTLNGREDTKCSFVKKQRTNKQKQWCENKRVTLKSNGRSPPLMNVCQNTCGRVGVGRCASTLSNPVGCTDDLKECPDGTSVARELPSCEFPACPTPTPSSPPSSNGDDDDDVNPFNCVCEGAEKIKCPGHEDKENTEYHCEAGKVYSGPATDECHCHGITLHCLNDPREAICRCHGNLLWCEDDKDWPYTSPFSDRLSCDPDKPEDSDFLYDKTYRGEGGCHQGGKCVGAKNQNRCCDCSQDTEEKCNAPGIFKDDATCGSDDGKCRWAEKEQAEDADCHCHKGLLYCRPPEES